MQQQAIHHKKINKKGQVYPVSLAIILLLALTYAFFALQDSKKICTDSTKPCDANNPTAYIGAKQNQIFYTLQDAEGIKLFIDQSARLAAEKSMDDIKISCHYESSVEEISDELSSSCGKHIYPMWSNKDELCLPDCTAAMTSSFYTNLNEELSKYYLATGITLPRNYKIKLEQENKAVYLYGQSVEPITINSYPVKQRTSIQNKPEAISQIETQTRNDFAEKEQYGTLKEDTPAVFNKMLAWPVSGSKQINSCFGARNIRGGSKNHLGLDIQSADADVLSPALGYVENAGNPEKTDADIFSTKQYDIDSCWGRVIINHGSGIRTVFLHMQEIYVKPGQKVEVGQVLGKAGGRGRKCDSSTCFNSCIDNQYDKHIHMEVHYDGVPASGKVLYSPDPTNYGSQFLAKKTSQGYAVNPLCILDTTSASFTGSNCGTPVNKNLQDVCLKVGLNKILTTQTTRNAITGDAIASFSLNEIKPESTYSFSPSFKIKINKQLDDPLKEVTEWSEKTWNECTDDIAVCINKKIDEFNNDESRNFQLRQAAECEEDNKDIFFDMMEFYEDCLSNEQFGCKCEFNATNYLSSQDFTIITDATKARLYAVELDAGKEILAPVEGAEYELFSGSINAGSLSFKEFRFKFNEDTTLNQVIFSAYNQDEKGNRGESSIISEGDKSILLVKVQDNDGKRNLGELVSPLNDNYAQCLPRKDKFRLCAIPKESRDSLFPVKFAMQLKDEPPKKFCEDAEMTVTPENIKMDSQVKQILSVKGFDVSEMFSAIPIPIFQLAGQSLALSDLVSSLPDSQNAKLRVTVKNNDPDIVGYNVYCNDLPVEITGTLEKTKPDQFALIKSKAAELENSGMTAYVENNPFRKYLRKEECGVSVVTSTGRVEKVSAVTASKGDGVDTFTITKCSGNSVLLDKMVENNYCVTLVPVDKQGREFKDCSISSCEKTNSLINLAITRLVESKYSETMVVIKTLLPEELRDHIKLPDTDDFKDWAEGKKGMTDLIDTDGVTSSLKSSLKIAVFEELNEELAGTTFQDSIDSLDDANKQTVLSKISQSIKDDDAKEIFKSVISGNTIESTAKNTIITKSTNFVNDETAKEILQNYLKNADLRTTAFKTLESEAKKEFEKMTNDEKKELLTKALEKDPTLKNKAIQKARSKNCINSITATAQAAMNCLDSTELNKLYSEGFVNSATSQILLQTQIDQLPASKQKEILGALAGKRDFQGLAKTQLINEIEKLPDSSKKEILSSVFEGTTEKTVQNELAKMLPARPELISTILKDSAVQNLIGETLKSKLESQLKLFLSQECIEKK